MHSGEQCKRPFCSGSFKRNLAKRISQFPVMYIKGKHWGFQDRGKQRKSAKADEFSRKSRKEDTEDALH